MRRRGCISGNKKEGFYPPRGKVDLGSGGTTPPIPRVLPRENSPAPMSPEKHKEKASAFADAFVIACSFHTRSLNLGKRIYINLPRVSWRSRRGFSPAESCRPLRLSESRSDVAGRNPPSVRYAVFMILYFFRIAHRIHPFPCPARVLSFLLDSLFLVSIVYHTPYSLSIGFW